MSKFKIGSQWKTRDGGRAVVIDTQHGRVVAWHKNNRTIQYHYDNGSFYMDSDHQDDRDLVEPWKEPIVHEKWLNIYADHSGQHNSKKEADVIACPGRLACIKIIFAEGDGLD